MPALEWMGKDKVIGYHRQVPYRVLDRIPDKGVFASDGTDRGNKIIHGDNLEALKSLLPEYESKVDCIYIDPPYNTGNEGWVYNDNVNDPRIRRWIGEVVGKEGEDFSRHDKWLCMMYPRLQMLRSLLSEEGFIAVSINDVELPNLGELLDDVFGRSNRLACAPWRSEKSGGKEKTALRTGHEYIYFYRKSASCRIMLEEKSTGALNLSDEFGEYTKGRELRKWGATSDRADRPNGWFGITAPDGSIAWPYKNDGTEGYWRWTQKKSEMQDILANPVYAHWEMAPYDDGVTVNGQHSRWVPYEKIRAEKKSFGWNTWLDGYGTNSDATAELKSLFGEKAFDTPKPVQLVKWIVSLAYDDDAIILDSFAGSGTTAQAVMELNKEDGGSRRFLLVEMCDYADDITAERCRKVIGGYETSVKVSHIVYEKKLTASNLKNAVKYLEEAKAARQQAVDTGEYDKVGNPKLIDNTLTVIGETSKGETVPGIDSGFSYYELGPVLFTSDGMLNPDVPREELFRYVWYTEAKAEYQDLTDEHPYLLGELGDTVYYLAYNDTKETALGYSLLGALPRRGATTVIYADRCVLPQEKLDAANIVFKQIPRQIARV